MTSRDESLRALEKEMRGQALDGPTQDWRPNMVAFADRIAALLSDRQEVAPVADERLCDFFADVGEVEQFMDDLCNVVTELTGDEGDEDPITVLRRHIDNTSTGQTSDDSVDAIEIKTVIHDLERLGREDGWLCASVGAAMLRKFASQPIGQTSDARDGEIARLCGQLADMEHGFRDMASKWSHDAAEMTHGIAATAVRSCVDEVFDFLGPDYDAAMRKESSHD